MTPADLTGRVALVTGGASGIGLATVRMLQERGATVVAADIEMADAANLHLDVDVTSEAAVDDMVATTIKTFGQLDIAVNAAGVSGQFGNVGDQKVDEWRRVIEVNLTSVFLCVRVEVQRMAETGGTIANVASAAGSMGVPGMAHYSASKHGVIGLTKSVALEYARSGLRVNAVLPGPVRTPMLQRFAGGDEGVDNMGRMMPIGRAAEPDEIARAIVWLCSNDSSYVTGHCLAVDGGSLAT